MFCNSKSLIVVLKKNLELILKNSLKSFSISFFVLFIKISICFFACKGSLEITGVELQLECHVFPKDIAGFFFKTDSHATVPEIVQFKIEFSINTSVLISIGTSSILFKFFIFL